MDSHTPPTSHIEAPPSSIPGILRRLGPGLIIAGSIVGSGELIATTRTGAQAGFSLLWLIIIGCIIKVFTQVEFGRFTISSGKTAMEGLNELPGPRFPFGRSPDGGPRKTHANWFICYWVIMTLVGVAQLGGIVGAVGQSLAIPVPITQAGRAYNEASANLITSKVSLAQLQAQGAEPASPEVQALQDQIAVQTEALLPLKAQSKDDRYWATIISVITAVVLVVGRYGLIQAFATALVVSFTAITIGNLFALQGQPNWAVTPGELLSGLSFRLGGGSTASGTSAIGTALMTFGIIGVGAAELLAYPYWCLEKGYGRFTGPRDETDAWADRATGWIRVLRWDAWCSMFVYTFATIAFYLLGAAILWRVQLLPEGTELVATLSTMYVPVFGDYAGTLFLFGAFAVLYSTFFVSSAGNARIVSDAFRVTGLIHGQEGYERWVRILSGLYPLVSLAVYWFVQAPAQMVLLSGAAQAIMLPMLGGAALYWRYKKGDARIAPGKAWDAMLWLSAFGMLVVGVYLLIDRIS
jgi:Mn2+/Fe2+ NRAMP family transporter